MVFTNFDLTNLKLNATSEEVVIYCGSENDDTYKEVVKWIKDEWESDSEVYNALFEAINLYHTNRVQLLETLGHQYAIEFIPTLNLDDKAIALIQHLENQLYIWFETADNKNELIYRLVSEFQESGYDDPTDFMEHMDYFDDGDIIKVASLRGMPDPKDFEGFKGLEPSYKDTIEVDFSEDLYLIDNFNEYSNLEPYEFLKKIDRIDYVRFEK